VVPSPDIWVWGAAGNWTHRKASLGFSDFGGRRW